VEFASDAAPLVILQLEQTRREIAEISIGSIQVRGALLDTGFELNLGLPQHFVLAPTRFRHDNNSQRREQERRQENELLTGRHRKRV
jgi:hypothetical protein